MKQVLRTFPEQSLFGISVLAFLILSVLMTLDYAPAKGFSFLRLAAGAGEAPVPPPPPQEASVATTSLADLPQLYAYVQIINSCGPYYQGTCVNMRSGPGTEYPSVARLRNGVVLKVAETVTNEGRDWYRIAQDSGLHHPERITSDWYVAGDVVQLFYDDGDHRLKRGEAATTTKHILIDLSKEMLYAYNGDGSLFMKQAISTGLDDTPTPVGTFIVFKMTPSRYMQGPIDGGTDQYYDLPGVPWNLYFTKEGAAIHGTYWHNHFGRQWSHGCVNLPPQAAEELYFWADLGTKVTIEK